MIAGQIVREGGKEVAKEVETKGFDWAKELKGDNVYSA